MFEKKYRDILKIVMKNGTKLKKSQEKNYSTIQFIEVMKAIHKHSKKIASIMLRIKYERDS